jgi:hypothetical protein
MSFCIILRKPRGLELDDNDRWIRVIKSRLPEFADDGSDWKALARDLAEDVGLTQSEYVRRGIGLALEYETDELSVRVRFWTETAEIELLNFPWLGVEIALERTMPLLHILEGQGFTVLDPETGQPFDEPLMKALQEAYVRRQTQVERVAKLTGGSVG